MRRRRSLTPFTYAQMIWAVTYGYVIFGQLPDRWSVLGIVVIVTSGMCLAAMEHRRMRAWLTRPGHEVAAASISRIAFPQAAQTDSA